MTAQEWKPGMEGIFYDLPAEVYHAAPGFSHSMAKHMEPPARLPVYLSEPREPTVHMIMGTLVHQRILEPNKEMPRIALKPEGMKFSATEGKAWKAAREAEKKIILTQSEFDAVTGCVGSISKDARCQEIFKSGKSEVSLFLKHPKTGVMCKARLDWVPDGNYLADIKKCQDGQAEENAFSKLLYDSRYYTQAAWYLTLWNALGGEGKIKFKFIAVEGVPPYLVNIITVRQDAIDLGIERMAANLAEFERCSRLGIWPGYTGEHEVGLLAWATSKDNDKLHGSFLDRVRSGE
jgi:hypothetical protein